MNELLVLHRQLLLQVRLALLARPAAGRVQQEDVGLPRCLFVRRGHETRPEQIKQIRSGSLASQPNAQVVANHAKDDVSLASGGNPNCTMIVGTAEEAWSQRAHKQNACGVANAFVKTTYQSQATCWDAPSNSSSPVPNARIDIAHPWSSNSKEQRVEQCHGVATKTISPGCQWRELSRLWRRRCST